ALQNIVRTMNNLTSTFMLRLDMANSFLQTVSTPILALPVVMEAKNALHGTAEGKVLENALSVVNPQSGLREPTAAKLIADGYREYFTDNGKILLQGLR